MPNNVKYSPFAVRLPSDLRQKLEEKAKEESNLKKFADAYAESMKLAAEYGADTYHGLYIGIWH